MVPGVRVPDDTRQHTAGGSRGQVAKKCHKQEGVTFESKCRETFKASKLPLARPHLILCKQPQTPRVMGEQLIQATIKSHSIAQAGLKLTSHFLPHPLPRPPSAGVTSVSYKVWVVVSLPSLFPFLFPPSFQSILKLIPCHHREETEKAEYKRTQT